jgi:hypothetical protein
MKLVRVSTKRKVFLGEHVFPYVETPITLLEQAGRDEQGRKFLWPLPGA